MSDLWLGVPIITEDGGRAKVSVDVIVQGGGSGLMV